MEKETNDISKCPFHNGSMKHSAGGGGTRNRDWWPNQRKVSILRQNSSLSDPMDKDFNYAEAFKNLDLEALVRHVLIHEIGHHFGFSDADMERIEASMPEAGGYHKH